MGRAEEDMRRGVGPTTGVLPCLNASPRGFDTAAVKGGCGGCGGGGPPDSQGVREGGPCSCSSCCSISVAIIIQAFSQIQWLLPPLGARLLRSPDRGR